MPQPNSTLDRRVLTDRLLSEPSLGRAIVLALAGSLVLAMSAKIQVPFWPVPATMQSLVVLLIGAAYGARLGAATVLLYLAEGLAGLPVFAGPSAGPAYMAGPTAGYLVGFVLAAGLVGWLADRGWNRSLGRAAVSMSVGHIVLFVPGVLWLAVLFGWSKAIMAGVSPFVLATVVKTALGAGIVTAGWSMAGRRR
jgi:biotin transport system substrate-specific component